MCEVHSKYIGVEGRICHNLPCVAMVAWLEECKID